MTPTETLAAAEAALAAARSAQEQVTAAAATARAYDASIAALGPCPKIPDAAAAAPTKPEYERPTAAEVANARALLENARTARALADKATRDLATAERGAVRAREDLALTQQEAARTTRLVGAWRQAPTDAARAKRERLGNLGVVDVVFYDPEAQGPVCQVTIYDRPWELASDGEKVVADAILRNAVRRESLPALPLPIDNVSAWNGGDGPWPDFGGPVWWLITDNSAGLTVTLGKPGRTQ